MKERRGSRMYIYICIYIYKLDAEGEASGLGVTRTKHLATSPHALLLD